MISCFQLTAKILTRSKLDDHVRFTLTIMTYDNEEVFRIYLATSEVSTRSQITNYYPHHLTLETEQGLKNRKTEIILFLLG